MYTTALNQCDCSLSQRNCLYFALTARPYRRYYPSYKIHQKIHKFVNHVIFKIVIFIALVLNIILLALLVSSMNVPYKVTLSLLFICVSMVEK